MPYDSNDPNRPLDTDRKLDKDPYDPAAGTAPENEEHGNEAVGAGAGALGGAGVGMAVGGPPGAVVGGAIGAVGGAMAGEATEGDDEAGAGAGGLAGGLAGAAVGGAIAGPPGAVVGGAVGAAGGAGAGDQSRGRGRGDRPEHAVRAAPLLALAARPAAVPSPTGPRPYHVPEDVFVIPPMRIAQVAPPIERVPPEGYGGTERVVYELVVELAGRGHESRPSPPANPTCRDGSSRSVRALRPAGHGGDVGGFMLATILEVLDREAEFDIIHSHLEWYSSRRPAGHLGPGRRDLPQPARHALVARRASRERPDGLVAISESQASVHPEVPWTIVHNGLTLDAAPFERRRERRPRASSAG